MINIQAPNPELLIYLHRSPEKLLELIKRRERGFEQNITPHYLKGIQDSYFEFFHSQPSYPIVVIDCDDIDYVHIPEHLDEIEKVIFKEYRPGLHRISMRLR